MLWSRKLVKRYLLLATILFSLMSFPPFFVACARTKVFSLVAPLWKTTSSLLLKTDPSLACIKQLEGENYLLRLEIAKLKTCVEQSHLLTECPVKIGKVVPAQVIYRDPVTWGSFIWVNVGKERGGIEKESPVLLGNALIGVVDFVGKKESKIRLITDVGLKPSVRVFRKGEFLAKGIVQGAGNGASLLRGVGFNYDFEDSAGKPRELRSCILQEGDLLITTGMDGVFPKGLKVAHVSKIYPLREGGYAYELEATPCASHLETLHTVFIIPPCGYEGEQEND